MTQAIKRLKATAAKTPPQPKALFKKGDIVNVKAGSNKPQRVTITKDLHLSNKNVWGYRVVGDQSDVASQSFFVPAENVSAAAKTAAKKTVALPKDVQSLMADYSELGDQAVADLTKALKTFGINLQVYDNGDDSVLVTLSKTKLTKAQQKSIFNDGDEEF